jgi:STE24 endopeptidase
LPSRRRGAQLAVLAALAAVWAGGAWYLWGSAVPSSLKLPHLDERAFFSAAQIHRSASFQSVSGLLWLGGVVVELGVFALYAWRGARFAKESAAGPLGTGMLLGMLGFALLWLAELPFQVANLWWDRRHGLVHGSYWSAIFGGWLGLGGAFVFLCVALAIVMGLARKVGEYWWILAAPAFVALAAAFAFVSPYLVTTHPLNDPALRSAVKQLEQREHVGSIPVVVENVKSDTSLPNAEAMGIGPSRRVVLFDTLVNGPFSTRAVRIVIAHELGHVKANHVLKEIGWYALFAFPGTFLIAWFTRRRGGMGRPEAVPLGLLALVVLQLLATPLQNAITRHIEAEADWRALQATHDPAGAVALFRQFVPTTLSEPNPPLWDYVMLEDHPTIMQRLAMVQAWRARYATSAAQLP